MKELAEQIDEQSQQSAEQVVNNVESLLASMVLILNGNSKEKTYTLQDGSKINKDVVNRGRLRTILFELRKLERETESFIYDGVLSSIEVAVLSTVSFYKNRFDAIVTKGELSPKKLVDESDDSGYSLKDRASTTSISYTDDLYKRIRQSLNKGHTVSQTINEVKKTFDGKAWELRRIVTTETFNAYRKQVGEIASRNSLTWIKIRESFPRHPRRKRHECFNYAHEDKYGMGDGVFKLTDAKIYYPHPQCTSWLELIELTREV